MRLPRLFRNRWKEALLDEAVLYWCLNLQNRDDPTRLINDIIQTALDWERDPAITEHPLPVRPISREAVEKFEREWRDDMRRGTKGIPEPSPPPPPPVRWGTPH